jgi:hypothetical protein
MKGAEMAKKTYVALQPSESVLVRAAATIYAAYIQHQQIPDDQAGEAIRNILLARAAADAIELARIIDEAVCSDSEMEG